MLQNIKLCNATILDYVKEKCDSVVIAGHKNPDGDCIGSALALAMALKKHNKTVYVILDSYSDKYDIIPGKELIYKGNTKDLYIDAIITVDSSSLDNAYIDMDLWSRAKIKINIDHHISNDLYGDYNHVFEASSASEIIFNIISEDIDDQIAAAIYAGIINDTGGFKHPSTLITTHHTAAELLKYNIPFSEIYAKLMFRHTFAEAKIFSVALSNLKMLDGYHVSYTVLTDDDMIKCGVTSKNLDGIVDFIFNLDEVKVAVFFSERKNGIKASMRSKGDINVSVLATELGGGGHKNAAGCTLEMSMNNALDIVLSKVKELLDS